MSITHTKPLLQTYITDLDRPPCVPSHKPCRVARLGDVTSAIRSDDSMKQKGLKRGDLPTVRATEVSTVIFIPNFHLYFGLALTILRDKVVLVVPDNLERGTTSHGFSSIYLFRPFPTVI